MINFVFFSKQCYLLITFFLQTYPRNEREREREREREEEEEEVGGKLRDWELLPPKHIEKRNDFRSSQEGSAPWRQVSIGEKNLQRSTQSLDL